MHLRSIPAFGLILLAAACSRTPEPNAVALFNASVLLDEPALERIRAHTERELRVPVRVKNSPRLAGKSDFESVRKAVQRVRSKADVLAVVLTDVGEETAHEAAFPESLAAVVQVRPVYTDDSARFILRVKKLVMRAAAFGIGLPPTPDPYCVTRDYQAAEELDRMGYNYSPPWQARFTEESEKIGLVPIPSSAFGIPVPP